MARRVLVLAILAVLVAPFGAHADGDQGFGESYRAALRGGGLVSEGVGLSSSRAGGPGSGTIAIAGIPAGAGIERAFLYWAVLAGDDDAVTFAGSPVTGTRIGRSADTCWFSIVSPDHAHDNRVYRADVTDTVNGNGSYAIADVGDVGGDADAQGASLVVVYTDPTVSATTTIVIDDGAITGGMPGPDASTITQTFATRNMGAGASSARLHVGVGDTSAAFDDGGMTLAGASALPADAFNGSDGPFWDDRTVDVSPALLAGWSADATISVGDDCMVWTYAAIEVTLPAGAVQIASPAPSQVVPGGVSFSGSAGPAAMSVRLSEGSSTVGVVPTSGGGWSSSATFGEGWHTVRAEGLDADGAPLPGAAEVTFRVDTRAPSINIDAPGFPPFKLFERVEARGTATDDVVVDHVRVTWRNLATGANGEIPVQCWGCGTPNANWNGDVPTGVGTYSVTATAFDGVGNNARGSTVVFVVRFGN